MKLIWITEARYIDGYRIHLTFNDGVKKIVNLSHRLHGEMFEHLRDVERFKDFRLNGWTIEWSGDADLAPEYLYSLAEK